MYEKGLHQDGHPQSQPENTYRDAKNVSLVREPGAITQELGVEEFAQLPEGYRIVGKAYFPEGDILLFLKGDAGSRLELLTESGLTLVLMDGTQTMDLGNLVQAVGTVNNQDERVVYWTDEVNLPRRLNLDLLTTTSLDTDFDLTLFYSYKTVPEVTPNILANGGVLRTGVYRIAVALVDDEGAVTPYLTVSPGVAVFPGGYLDPKTTTGGESTVNTSRAISVSVTGLPTVGFRGIRIATIKDTEVRVLGEYPLTGNYTITGAEAYVPGSLEEIVIAPISYSGAKAIAEQNGSLFIGNLSRGEDIGYQKYANNIRLFGITEEFDAAKVVQNRSGGTVIMGPGDNDYRKSENYVLRKTFKRGETYAFYITLILKDGSETPAYHIPGRPPIGTENSSTFSDPTDATAIGFTKQFHQESKLGYNGMGFWQNDTETYPETPDFENWDVNSVTGEGFFTGFNYGGRNVRHHQFPDAQYVPFIDGGPTQGKILGVKFEDINFPNEIKEQILGYRIYYAERGFENQRVLDQSLLVRTWKDDDFGGNVYPAPNNAQYTNSKMVNDFKVAYPFHMLRKKTSASAIQYVKHVTNLHSGGATGPYKENIDPSNAIPYFGTYVRKVEWAGYVEHDTDDVAVGRLTPKVFTNVLSPTVLVMEIPHWLKNYTNDVVDFCRFLPDQYFPFFGQRLVWTGFQSTDLDNDTTPNIFGGDTFVTYHAYRAIQPDDGTVFQGNYGLVYLHQQIVESLDLIALRHEGDLVYETYFPISDWFPGLGSGDAVIRSDFGPDHAEYNTRGVVAGENYNLYNEEFSSLNNIRTAFPWSPYTRNDINFPTRIARSRKNSLRTFLSEDFKDLTTKRGPIVKLTAFGSELLIHHLSSLFRTRGSTELVTGDVKAFIGSGNILDVEPEELFTVDEGYGGLQNPHSASLTPQGYVYADDAGKKIFILSQGLVEISGPGSGMRDFFNGNLNGTTILGYDPTYNRLFFTHGDEWTISYLPVEKVWESFHTGTPDAYVWNRNQVFSSLDAHLYIRGMGDEGEYYGVLDFFDFQWVHNKDPFDHKVISTLIVDSLVQASNGDEIIRRTIDNFRIESDHQDTGIIPVVYFTEPGGNARRTRRVWSINGLRDSTPPETYQGTLPAWVRRRLTGKHHLVRLQFQPQSDEKLTLFATDLTYRTSIR